MTLQVLAQRFTAAGIKLTYPMSKVKPEFGAYMLYSLYLEKGLVTKRFPARPHIVPAVEKSAASINQQMVTYLQGYLVRSISKGKVSAAVETAALSTAWLQVLNGPVRILAVNLAKSQQVYEFGFHIRSIAGYVKERSIQEVQEIGSAQGFQRDMQRAGSKGKA